MRWRNTVTPPASLPPLNLRGGGRQAGGVTYWLLTGLQALLLLAAAGILYTAAYGLYVIYGGQ